MKLNSTEIKNLEPIDTIAIPHTGDYSGIGEAFIKLTSWAEAHNLWSASPRIAGVYHDDPMHTPVEKLRSKACLENLAAIESGEGMVRYTISGGKYFVMQVEVTMAEYGAAWQKAYELFNEKGYKYDMRDHFELYVTCAEDVQDVDAPWVVEMCIPVR